MASKFRDMISKPVLIHDSNIPPQVQKSKAKLWLQHSSMWSKSVLIQGKAEASTFFYFSFYFKEKLWLQHSTTLSKPVLIQGKAEASTFLYFSLFQEKAVASTFLHVK